MTAQISERITIPYQWAPRPHQMPAWQYLTKAISEEAGARAALVWHRRAGKDSLSLNITAWAALQTVGNYWHLLPEYNQCRKAIWDAVDNDGRRIIDQVFPPAIRARTVDAEMKIVLLNGSTWQLAGSDRFDALVGANPRGLVFSEYAISDPRAWAYLRPILAANGGWAIFPSTPRGENHLKRVFDQCETSGRGFAQLLTVEETFKADGTPLISKEVLEQERLEMDHAEFMQEYYCSWKGIQQGAIYGAEMEDLIVNRVGHYPPDPDSTAIAVWDIGFRDATAIMILQKNVHTSAPVLVDYIEDRNAGLPHYMKLLQQVPLHMRWHFWPHDGFKHEWGTGATIDEQAGRLGLYPEQTPDIGLANGINNTRPFLRKLYVNETPRTQIWLDSLQAYKRKYDPERRIYLDKPDHNWASHGADSARYSAIVFDPALIESRFEPVVARPKVVRAMR